MFKEKMMTEPDQDTINDLFEDLSKALKEDGEKPTLRDQIAMAALTGLVALPNIHEISGVVVSRAYDYADAMLKQREGS